MSVSAERHGYAYQWFMLLAVFVLAALLQVGLAPRQSLWTDEIFSLATATGHSLEQPANVADPTRGDFHESSVPVQAEQLRRYLTHDERHGGARIIRAVLLSDTSPPLYYLLLNPWTIWFGTSDLALRLFSVLFSLASLPLIAGIARRTGGDDAVIPAFLFAVSPMALYFSNEARMYSLLVFLTVATVWISIVLSQTGGSVAKYILWGVTSAAGLLTHYFFIFPWLATVTYLLWEPRRLRRRHLGLAVLAVLIVVLPWYVRVPGQLSRWRVTKDWLKIAPAHFSFMRTAGKQFLQFFSCAGSGLWTPPTWSAIAALILFGCIFLIMIWRLRFRAVTGWPLLLWAWFIAASAGPLLMDILQHSYSSRHPRYALAALPAAYLLAGLAMTTLSRRARYIMLFLLAAAWFPSLLGIYHTRSRGNQPFRQLAGTLSEAADSSDIILVHSIPAGVLGVARYSNTPAKIATWVEQLGTRDSPRSMPQLAAGHRYVWYVLIEQTLGEPRPELEWLRQNMSLSATHRMQSITIMKFEPPGAQSF